MSEFAEATRRLRVLQIVPHRLNTPEGIGDYACLVAGGLRDDHAIDSTFVSGSPDDRRAPADDGWPTQILDRRSPGALIAAIDRLATQQPFDAVVLHVNGYGYAKRGVPFWLLAAMRLWRRRNVNVPLIGIFHELYSLNGKPWNSSFWLRGVQKFIARELWGLCDGAITTTDRYFADLLSWRPNCIERIAFSPVISTVGEPTEVVPFEVRARQVVVFGASGTGKKIFHQTPKSLLSVLRELEIEGITDIGARPTRTPPILGKIPVKSCGRLSVDEVAAEFKLSRFGMLSYDPTRLGKSTIFASYAAHGLIPICLERAPAAFDGLVPGIHYIVADERSVAGMAANDFSVMQSKLRGWYHQHNRRHLVHTIARMCRLLPDVAAQNKFGSRRDGLVG